MIKRETIIEAGEQYNHLSVAAEIKAIDKDDPEYVLKAARLIKRYVHAEKYSLLSRLCQYGTAIHNGVDVLMLMEGVAETTLDVLKLKRDTHKDWMNRPLEEMI